MFYRKVKIYGGMLIGLVIGVLVGFGLGAVLFLTSGDALSRKFLKIPFANDW